MKKERKLTMNIGIISFMVVFVILCVVTFALLSLVSARSNVHLSEKSSAHIQDYYALSNLAQDKIEEINIALNEGSLNQVSFIERKDSLISFDVKNEQQTLHVELRLKNHNRDYDIMSYKIISNKEWNPNEGVNIY